MLELEFLPEWYPRRRRRNRRIARFFIAGLVTLVVAAASSPKLSSRPPGDHPAAYPIFAPDNRAYQTAHPAARRPTTSGDGLAEAK